MEFTLAITIAAAIIASIYPFGWIKDWYSLVATAVPGLLFYILFIVIGVGMRRSAEAAGESEDTLPDDEKTQPWQQVLYGIILGAVLVGLMFGSKFVLDLTDMVNWFHSKEQVAFAESIEPLERLNTLEAWQQIETDAFEALKDEAIPPEWRIDLEELVLKSIYWQAMKADTIKDKREQLDRAEAWATEHGIDNDLVRAVQQAQIAVIPTPTPRPTKLPPTAIPPMVLPDGSTAELVRIQRVPGANVYYMRLLGPDGNPVTGLQSKDIQAGGGDVTVTDLSVVPEKRSMCVLIDASGSMGNVGIAEAKKGAKVLINSLLPDDEICILVFQGRSVTPSGWISGSNKQDAIDVIDAIRQGGDTPLYDALYQALQELKNRDGRPIIVVLSDGKNTSSRLITEQSDIMSLLPIIGAEIYPIRLGKDNEEFFAELATNGEVQVLDDPTQIEDAFTKISELVGDQYAILISGSEELNEIVVGGGDTSITIDIP